MIKIESINGNELRFLRFIQYFDDVVMNKTWKVLGRMRTDHLQPIYLYSCVMTQCYIPSFVGKVETLNDDIHWLEDNKKLGKNTKISSLIYSATHPTSRVKIRRGTIHKYKNALLSICKLYWNDFHCGGYQIPFECEKQNTDVWHFSDSCIDLNGHTVSWPNHR
eukprot:UN00858